VKRYRLKFRLIQETSYLRHIHSKYSFFLRSSPMITRNRESSSSISCRWRRWFRIPCSTASGFTGTGIGGGAKEVTAWQDPYYILVQIRTHFVFRRNQSSSRIGFFPTMKLIFDMFFWSLNTIVQRVLKSFTSFLRIVGII